MSQEVRVPDIGDFDAVEVIELCAAVGDSVGPDDPLVVIESDKASMEIPAGISGTIEKISVSIGDQVGEGDVIAVIADAESDSGSDAGVNADDDSDSDADADADADADDDEDAEVTAAESERQADQQTSAAESTPAHAAGESEIEVRVPDIGDATDVEVIEVAVSVGDRVGEDDLLVVVESDKASMEIPAGYDGVVSTVHVEVGAGVEEGSLLATLQVADSAADKSAGGSAQAATAKTTADKVSAADSSGSGSGTARSAASTTPPAAAAEKKASPPEPDSASADSAADVYAGPAVRRLARELGVDLSRVKATGNRGRILKDDVKSYVKRTLKEDAGDRGSGIPRIPEIDFSRFGSVEKLALSKVRSAGAANLHRSWLNVPHVTQFEEADVTELEEFRRSLKEEAQRRDVRITPLSFIVKACCYALKAYPTFNSSLDPEAKHFILKHYYNIGFAVDTEAGLVVPVIRNADQLGVWELSEAITELAEKARTQKLSMNDMQGGSFSISSLGGIGGTGFTPIINAPEVAILGVSRLVTKPVWDGGKFEPRQMLPLSLSYDHRAINGAEAGRFMASLAELLADIRRLAL